MLSRPEHLDLIFRKTACLFSTSMRLGAILGKASEKQEEALAEYGRNLGMAFQIVDDVLDLTATEEVLGKPVASDLREGKVTLAVIDALERCSSDERNLFAKILAERSLNGTGSDRILAILNQYGSVERANGSAAQYAAAARNALRSFPDSEIKRALLWIPEFVLEREK
jgi:octaprenyl-diphosphate synthase